MALQNSPVHNSALYVSGLLCALGLVLAALITAFDTVPVAEQELELLVGPVVEQEVVTQELELSVIPVASMLDSPRQVESAPQAVGPVSNPVYTVRATAYNSLPNQTDGDPHITATGTRTRFGIIAVSRDLLAAGVPYGSLVRINDLGAFKNGRGAGAYQELLDAQNAFIVEDTLHARKRNQIDVWFPHLAEALHWGVRQVEIEVIRYGYQGPELYSAAASSFDGAPRLAAVR